MSEPPPPALLRILRASDDPEAAHILELLRDLALCNATLPPAPWHRAHTRGAVRIVAGAVEISNAPRDQLDPERQQRQAQALAQLRNLAAELLAPPDPKEAP